MSFIKPFPLNSRAVFRLIHFDVWGSNFLRARLKLDQPVRVVPESFKIRHAVTGEVYELSTSLVQEDAVVAVMEQLRVADGH